MLAYTFKSELIFWREAKQGVGVWEEVASQGQIAWLKSITEGGARMLWDGRMHRDFISGMWRFRTTNGKETAKETMETAGENR